MLFLVIAKDGTDPDAPTRRHAVRDRHLSGARELAANGTLVVGGALLNDAGGMIGSALILEAENADHARTILHNDIYHRSGVWQTLEIHPFKRAV